MRRAEWRRRADDPATLSGWWWRGASHQLSFPLCSGVTMLLIVSGQVGGAVLFLVVALLVGAVQIARSRDSLRPLLPDPPPQGQFRAWVSYRRDGLTTGTDEVALVVVDGWLVAEGVRSHFALRPTDVGFSPRLVGDSYALRLTDGSWIAFRGLDERGRRIVKAWREFENDPPGEPTFPPAGPSLPECARAGAWAIAGFALITLPSLVATLLRLGTGFAEIKIGVALLGAAMGCLSGRKINRLLEIQTRSLEREAL